MTPFVRCHTDGTETPLDVTNHYAGPTATPCWLLGGGPSLATLDCHAIAASPAPVFALNLAGHGLLRPDFWTCYDPTQRFHPSIYLDPSITKFIHHRKRADVVAPDRPHKLCDCPATLFFKSHKQRGFADFLPPPNAGIVDWNDTMVQAIEIAYRLGFRTLFLAGTDMAVRPSPEQITAARSRGIDYHHNEPLRNFANRVYEAGVDKSDFAQLPGPPLYHFDETKGWPSTVNTDQHYYRVCQYLRLARRSIALAGLSIVSVTPDSRLNRFFNYIPLDQAVEQIHALTGDPRAETCKGRYTSKGAPPPAQAAPMKDFPPHNWHNKETPPQPPAPKEITL